MVVQIGINTWYRKRISGHDGEEARAHVVKQVDIQNSHELLIHPLLQTLDIGCHIAYDEC